MWCASCQADVAAEVSADNSRLTCASCGSDLGTASPSSRDRTRQALELLERWSSGEVLDPFGPVNGTRRAAERTEPAQAPGAEAPSAAAVAEPPRPETHDDAPNVRVHTAEADTPRGEQGSLRAETPPHAVPPRRRTVARGPAFDLRQRLRQLERPSGWTATAGQLLAYAGVAVLMVGSMTVLWGYFGEVEGYAPTGWLISTAGQMLLFLGVITLVSGGLEQTAEETKRRLDLFGEYLQQMVESAPNSDEQTAEAEAAPGPTDGGASRRAA